MSLRRRPIDAVVFDPRALLDTSVATDHNAGRARAGIRRLFAALASHGVEVAVLADDTAAPGAPDDPPPLQYPAGRLKRMLAEAGLAGGGLRVGPAQQLAAPGIIDTDRTLIVVTPDSGPLEGRLQASPPATIVVAPPDEPVHWAVQAELAEHGRPFTAASLLCGPLDDGAVRAAGQHQLRLTKPPGSLGRIETVGAQLAGIAGSMPPPRPRPAAIAVFAGDHGVHRQGVSPWPQEVTTQMVANFLDGGAAISVLARQADAEVVVVDVGVAGDLAAAPGLLDRKVRRGTADLCTGPAMTPDEARRALDVGAEVAARLVADGARCLVTGDMGIANTTPSAALVAALTGRPAAAVTGRGTGIGDDLLARKSVIVEQAAARARERHGDDALAVLAEVGGLEHAALAGFVTGGAALQVPVVVDGVIAAASLLVAARLVPGVEHGVVAGHRSVEPGAAAVLGELGLDPLLDLELRLGEGTGATLALPLVEAAARVLDEMATFDQAGVSDKRDR